MLRPQVIAKRLAGGDAAVGFRFLALENPTEPRRGVAVQSLLMCEVIQHGPIPCLSSGLCLGSGTLGYAHWRTPKFRERRTCASSVRMIAEQLPPVPLPTADHPAGLWPSEALPDHL